jgi:hypothetical protein
MRIICPGLMKTETTSLKTSLRIIGYKTNSSRQQVEEFGDEFYHGAIY